MDSSIQGQKQQTEPKAADCTSSGDAKAGPSKSNTSIPISTNIQCLESQSYHDMLQTMKKLNQNLSELEDQVMDLQCRWADCHLKAGLMFDPEIAQIIQKYEVKRAISSSATATALTDDETNPANEEEEVSMEVDVAKAEEELTAQGLSYDEIDERYQQVFGKNENLSSGNIR